MTTNTNRKVYRKKTVSEPAFIVEYIDNNNQKHSFKSTKAMLQSHKILMSNNRYIKSFSVKPINV